MIEAIPWNREPISAPGLYSDIPIEAYHGDLCVGPSVSSSGLRTLFNASPAHYYSTSYLNPDREEETESQPLILGRAAHHLLLGQAAFARHFVVRPEEWLGKPWNSNRTDCKEWLAARKAEKRTVLKGEEITHIRGMAHALHAHPMVAAGMLNGLVEHSMIWRDEKTGVFIKVRPDAVPTDDLDVADLKTIADISDDGIERAVGGSLYYVQAALTGMACRAVLGRPMSSFSLVFAEKTPPYCVRVKTLKPDDLELGEKIARAAIDQFARCVETGEWPGPGGTQSDAEYVEIRQTRRDRALFQIECINRELAA